MRRQKRTFIALFSAALLLAALGAGAAAAAPKAKGASQAGSLDRAFGAKGRVFASAPGGLFVDLAMGPNGEIAVARGNTLHVYEPDGRPRAAFGGAGVIAILPPAGQSFELAGIAIDSQGRVLVAGTSRPADGRLMTSPVTQLPPSTATVMRYTAAASLDPTFGEGGVFRSNLGLPPATYPVYSESTKSSSDQSFPESTVSVRGITVDAADRPLITGSSVARVGHGYGGVEESRNAFVAWLTSSGSLDTGVTPTGVVSEPANQTGFGFESASDPFYDGQRLLYLSTSHRGRATPDWGSIVARLGASPDPAFAGSGYRKLPVTSEVGNMNTELADGRDGRVLTLESRSGADPVIAKVDRRWDGTRLARYQADGRPDRSFGKRGEVRIRHTDELIINSVAADGRGRPLVAGIERRKAGSPGAYFPIRLERRLPDGQPDRRFGRDGSVLTGFGRQALLTRPEVLVDGTGGILVAATLDFHGEPGRSGFVLARYRGK